MLPIISILMCIWLYREAKVRSENSLLWALLGLFFSFLAIGIFHLKHGQRIQGIVALIFGIFVYGLSLQKYFV
ncbi:MAG: hypothetical protein K0R47_3484 [Brevibacillus sp.]|nr:hypothetical protein [Brevibacillus sp.]